MRLLVTMACAAMLVVSVAGGADRAAVASIEPLTQMAVPRAVHTATRLSDGTVLIVGGCTTRGCELGGSAGLVAELYLPGQRRFARVGRLRDWRDDHTASLLDDGRVLVAGGWGAHAVIASSEIYEPQTRTFSRGPRMRARRAGASATTLADGRVLLAGGFTGNRPTIANAEVFLPQRRAFRSVSAMTAPRGGHAAARLHDGRVLIVGGLSRGRVVATTEIFEPRTNRFRPAASMLMPRYKTAAVTLADGRVLVVGGAADIDGRRLYNSTEIYDPRRGRFTTGPPLQFARYKLIASVVRLTNGGVLVAGGASAAELLDPRSGQFRVVDGQLDAPRLFSTASPLARGQALVVGGYDLNITPTRQAWLYR